MAQILKPISPDIAVNSWTTTPLYEQINETTASDTDYIQYNGVAYCEVTLDTGTDPNSSSEHYVRYRYGRDRTDRTLTLVVRLMQGSTEIASWTHVDPSLSFVDAQQTLTTGQADSITNYSDLRLRFDITAIQNSQVYGQVSWAEMEIPDVQAQTHEGESDIVTQSDLSSEGSVILDGESDLITQSQLSLLGGLIIDGSSDLVTQSDIQASGTKNINGQSDIQTQSELVAVGSTIHATWNGESDLLAQSELQTVGTLTEAVLEGSADLSTQSNISSSTTLIFNAECSILTSSNLSGYGATGFELDGYVNLLSRSRLGTIR